MDMNHSVHEESRELQDKHWQGQYFGLGGVIEDSRKKYDLACAAYARHFYDEVRRKECTKATIGYLSTLYSAFNHSARQALKGKFEHFRHLLETLDELDEILAEAIFLYNDKELNAGEKEVLMAVLLVVRFARPLSGYRALAIKLGEEIVSEYEVKGDAEGGVALSTYLLAMARLSRLFGCDGAGEFRDIVREYITDKEHQQHLGWKTINRLARLVGDKEMVKLSARMDGSPDILLKSGM